MRHISLIRTSCGTDTSDAMTKSKMQLSAMSFNRSIAASIDSVSTTVTLTRGFSSESLSLDATPLWKRLKV